MSNMAKKRQMQEKWGMSTPATYTENEMCKFISNKLRESFPTGRAKLRRGNRVPIIHDFLQFSRLNLEKCTTDTKDD